MKRLDDAVAALVMRWTHVYSAGIDEDIRDQRRAEIRSDVWEHRREAEAAGLRRSQIALEIAARWLVGIPADVSWRRAMPRAAVRVGGDVMTGGIRTNWWIVPALALAVLNVGTGIANLDPGWIPPQPQSDPFALVVVGLGVVIVAGVALRHRVPKLAGLLVLSGSWVPLLTPTYNAAVSIIGVGAPIAGGGGIYLGPIGVVLAILAIVGAVQNMARRPHHSLSTR